MVPVGGSQIRNVGLKLRRSFGKTQACAEFAFITSARSSQRRLLMMRFRMLCVLVATALAVSGCGGGGGSAPPPPPPPSLSGNVSNIANVFPNATNASYSITVSNAAGSAATSGTVTVTDPPTNFTVTAISGTGWTCTLATLTCTRSDALAAGLSYPPITVVGTVTGTTGQSISIPITIAGGGQTSTANSPGSITIAAAYTLGGTVSGLTGTGLVLQNNGGNNLSVNAGATSFTFLEDVAGGSTYSVTVLTQPSGPAENCQVTNGSGTANANVTNVQVACTIPTYTIGGTVSGLTGAGLVLQDNGGDNLSVSANGAFTFATKLQSGATYDVTVFAQPAGQTCAAASNSGTVASAAITTVVVACSTPANVDFGSSVQTIRGFGGSTAWMPTMTGAQADALFANGNSQEIGLSILRVRIDPGGSANWSTELGNANEAQTRGAIVIATPWTPPASMKSNSSTVGGELNTGSYSAYATYLESFVTYMANGGVTLYGISMQNEPDANVTYESCGWTGAQMDTWVANDSSVITANPTNPTKLIMPESESFTTTYSDPALNDASAVGHISIIAGHLYGVSPTYYTNAETNGKDVWMTEHYLNPSGSSPSIGDALAMAKEIHDSMTVGDYNAYLWWWVADWNPGTGVTNYGLVDTNNNPTLYGYAMAQYAKFVRPGYVRSNATYSPNSNVYVSAYKGNGHYVIVALNLGSSSVSQPFTIQNASVTSLTPYQTSAGQSLAQLSTVNVSGDAFTFTLPALSITTFVQ
jgi:glucuronoarabinoxylan endo-1,4-beta-xylanase